MVVDKDGVRKDNYEKNVRAGWYVKLYVEDGIWQN